MTDRALAKLTASSPPSATTVVTIQYLRALAASLVVLQHAMAVPDLIPYYPRPWGQYGVDVFFVISGYIMWMTTAVRGPTPPAFMLARIIRIVPMYWIFTTLFIVIAVAMPKALFHPAVNPLHIFESYFFIPVEHPRLGIIRPIYTLGWTLNYEMFFYFVFGCCLLIPRHLFRFAAVVGVLFLLVSMGWSLPLQGAVVTTYTNPILLEFAAGVVLAVTSTRLQSIAPAVGWGLIAAASVWLLAVYAGETLPDLIFAHGVPAVAMVAGALILEPVARARPSRIGLLLGDASYSIYLAHPFAERAWYFAFGYAFAITAPAEQAAFVATSVMAGIAGGVASFSLLERPVLDACRRLRRAIGGQTGSRGLKIPLLKTPLWERGLRDIGDPN
jgi:exopolysaccharide production protein ExoZ